MKHTKILRKTVRTTLVLAVLGLAFGAAIPSTLQAHATHSGIGPNGGTCATIGSGDPSGPSAKSLVSTDGLGSITYVIERECLIKGATTSDSADVVYKVSATCSGVCPADAGTIGSLTAADKQCNQSGGTCTLGTITAGTGTIPLDGTELTILTGGATVDSFPPKGRNTVAQLGSVAIDVPSGFTAVATSFSIAFRA